MTTTAILQAVRRQDWHSANEAFSKTMSAKIALALANERKNIFTEETKDNPLKQRRTDESVIYGNEMPHSEVQRIYDEIGDALETESLCGIRNLQINDRNEVISFIG
jgi:hypothetical protein